ncbi:MAG: polyphosphate kinase 2 family protein [Candidatus Eisenbacteria bacterium]
MANPIASLLDRYRVTDGKKFRLKKIKPSEIGGLDAAIKDEAKDLLADACERMYDLQAKLYAEDRWAVLLIFQAMDAAGKDGTIKYVMAGVDPTGSIVTSFKKPSAEELDHDYLWRCNKALPERGRIGIFNRSYYEETLIVRVHPEILKSSQLPAKLVTRNIWKERFEDIRDYERYLSRNGILVLKFFLHLSKKEQKKRFLSRLEQKQKNWKFSLADAQERTFWKQYQAAYEDAIRNTATPHAPWFVVPADNKWFTRLVVAEAIVDGLASVKSDFPKLDAAKLRELGKARAALLRE